MVKAIVVPAPGGADAMKFEEIKLKPVGDDDIRVKVAYAGINFIDTYQRSGLYDLPDPKVLGREGSGVVVEVGKSVTSHKVGDRVAYLFIGSYAEEVVMPAGKAFPVPAGLNLQFAGAALLQGLTAHYLTQSLFPIKQGDTVLIHAGAGGTGAIAIQMAKLRGARVLTTVSTEEKAKIAKAAGADEVIMYTQVDFQEAVMKLTDGKGVDCVYDGVGLSTWEKSMLSLRKRGLLCLFGNASGAVPPIDPLLLSKHGSLFVTRPTLVNYLAGPGEKAARIKELFEWLAQGHVQLAVAKVFPLQQAGAAHEFLVARKALGKILLSAAADKDETEVKAVPRPANPPKSFAFSG